MSDWFLLYLLTRVNDVSSLMVFFAAGLMAFPCLAALGAFLNADMHDEREAVTASIKAHKNKLWFGVAILCVAALVPSRNDIVFIVGGSKLMEISRGETASRLGSKTLSIVEKYLHDAAKEEVKQ